MALYIEAGFDLTDAGGLSLVITEATGSLDVTAAITSGRYCHTDISGVIGSSLYDDIGGALKASLDAASIATGNSWTYTVTWSRTAGTYTISASGGNIALKNTTNAFTFALLGFSGAKSSAASHVSDIAPTYWIEGAMGTKSNATNDYEPDDIASEVEADDGSHYGIVTITSPDMYQDWSILYEPLAATHIHEATAAVPWTYGHLFTHCRNVHPFLVTDDIDQGVHYFRAGGASFRPEPNSADNHALWNMEFRTRVRGRL